MKENKFDLFIACGIIGHGTSLLTGCETVVLEQSDGYKIDLISRVSEHHMNQPSVVGKDRVNIRFWISDVPIVDIKERFLEKLYNGSLYASMEMGEFWYSEYTSDTYHETTLKVGNHDILKYLQGQIGKYVLIEIEFIIKENGK